MIKDQTVSVLWIWQQRLDQTFLPKLANVFGWKTVLHHVGSLCAVAIDLSAGQLTNRAGSG